MPIHLVSEIEERSFLDTALHAWLPRVNSWPTVVGICAMFRAMNLWQEQWPFCRHPQEERTSSEGGPWGSWHGPTS